MRNNSRQVMIIAMLLVAVVGLSVGFAAFSNTLSINSTAKVNPNASDFSLVFANNTDINNLNVGNVSPANVSTGTGPAATINNQAQGGPKLTGLGAEFTEPGQVVEYDLYIVNNGNFDAYLTDLVFNNVEGESVTKTCNKVTEGYGQTQWATNESLAAVCSSINVSVRLNNHTYTNTSNLNNLKIEKGSNKQIKVIITYSGSNRADGPMRIRIGSISINATTVGTSTTPIVDENPWETRGIESPYAIYDTIYTGPEGNMEFLSNGGLVFFGSNLSNSMISSMINDGEFEVYSDGFALIDDGDSFLFIVTGNGTAIAYASFGTSTTNRNIIISEATEAETILNYVLNPWVTRGIESSYMVYNEAYDGLAGDIKLLSNGDLVFLGDDISSSDIESKISNNEMEIYSDGFSITDGENSYVFIVTGTDEAIAYASFGSVTTNRSTIISEATEAETVLEYEISRVNPWLKRNMSPEYISFDEVYSGALGDIEFYSNGDSRIFGDDSFSSGSIDYLMNNNQMIVYSDGFLLCPDGTHYFLFVGHGDGTASVYYSTSSVSSFTKESMMERTPMEYIISSS